MSTAMLERIGTLPEDLGKPETLLADTGYFSEANVALCAAAQIDPMIAQGRHPQRRQLHSPKSNPQSDRLLGNQNPQQGLALMWANCLRSGARSAFSPCFRVPTQGACRLFGH
jgi:hypothetical protein